MTLRLAIVVAFVTLVAPARPARADALACKAKGGTWKTEDGVAGCLVKGKRDGAWESRLLGGQLWQRDTYVNGIKDGPSVSFHPESCHIATRGSWKAGVKDGLWATWLQNGMSDTEGTYAAGKREGTWRFFTEGVKVIEGPFVDDSAEGLATEWFTTAVQWRTTMLKAGERTGDDEVACAKVGGEWLVDHKAREEGCAENGFKSGVWRGYAGDGKLSWRSTFRNDVEHGEHVDYHPTGEVLRRGQIVDGVPDGVHEFRARDGKSYGISTITKGSGTWRAWYPDGVLAEHGEYVEGQKHGLWRLYHPKGHVLDETTWDNGALEGLHRDYYQTGELGLEGHNAGGFRSGIWSAYYTNGKIAWAGAYAEGSRVGLWYNGSYTGVAESVGPMVDDLESGEWIQLHKGGALAATGSYVRGRKHGRWVEWWPSGELWRAVDYVDGVEHNPDARKCSELGGAWVSDPQQRTLGCQVCRAENEEDDGPITKIGLGVWTWWYPNGVVEKRGKMADGKREGGWQYWFDNGQLMLEGALAADKEQGRWTGHYRDGKPRFAGSYQDGASDGDWTSFHADGTTAAAGRYDAGKKVGRWTYHHPGGAKKEEGDYADGLPVGAWTSYHPDGKRASAGSYVAGLREGDWTFWRPDGSPWRTVRYVQGKEPAAAPAK
jgi:antitoxin component YwqK of YwqJK toxin-antitoxin module